MNRFTTSMHSAYLTGTFYKCCVNADTNLSVIVSYCTCVALTMYFPFSVKSEKPLHHCEALYAPKEYEMNAILCMCMSSSV